jgi:bifunctional DNase/RNase
MDVLMELSRILITEMGDQQVIFLREKSGERTFPILIGTGEALAIDRRLKNIPTPRPMTHDLLANVIEAMGGSLEKIVIGDLHEHTFIATLFIRCAGEVIEVDSRPSDAIALGVAFETPIYVAQHVLEEILREPSSPAEKLEMLRQRLEMLGERIAELSEQLEDKEFLAQAPASVVQDHRRQLQEMKQEFEQIDRVLKKLG